MSTFFKLEEITGQYRSFVDNQVLTAKQLNEIVDFFEDQQRLTRTRLIGVGIVCGLQIKQSGAEVHLSHGCGVTTDGDLLHHAGFLKAGESEESATDLVFKNYKTYDDQAAHYPPFWKNAEEQIQLWELFTEKMSEGQSDLKPLADLPAEVPFNDLAAILYLENYPKDTDLCTAADCDSQGVLQVSRHKLLLAKKADIEAFVSLGDSIFKNDLGASDALVLLPDMSVPRLVLNASLTKNYDALSEAYKKIILASAPLLRNALQSLFGDFGALLDPANAVSKPAILNTLTGIFNESNLSPARIQYRYDFLKDLAEAYNELKEMLFELRVQCCPSYLAFPKHLLLGAFGGSGSFSTYRHGWYPSPATVGDNLQVKKLRALFIRLTELVRNFSNPPDKGIKVTPSHTGDVRLGARALPFYYNFSNELLDNWDFEKGRRGQGRRTLSYNADQYALPGDDATVNALKYGLDKHNFFRVEGHQGREYAAVLKELIEIKSRNGLAIDILSLRIGTNASEIDTDKYACVFEDLETMLLSWRTEQECLFSNIAKFFSGFQTDKPGIHIAYADKLAAMRSVRAVVTPTKAAIQVTGAKTGNKIVGLNNLYQVNTSVPDNLVIESNTAGAYIFDILDKNPEGSFFDWKAETDAKIETIKENPEWQLDDVKVALEVPAELMLYAGQATKFIPDSIKVADKTSSNKYRDFVEKMCRTAEKSKTTLVEIFSKTTYNKKGYEERYLFLLDQILANCCAAEGIEVIMDEIEKRKQEILDLTSFEKYTEKHPGLEHLAGVPKGGTFVLVYKESPKSQVIAVRLDNASEFTVVADFCLPYLCCSDCPPVAYILPKEKVSLRLPAAYVCLDENTRPLRFEASPANGNIKADIGGEAIVETNEEGISFFNPSKLAAEFFGRTIKFTVDDQLTDCSIIVLRKPKPAFGFNAPEYDPERKTATVQFVNKTESRTGDSFTYFWEFGDGQTSGEANPPAISYALDQLREKQLSALTVKLTVSNGRCVESVDQILELDISVPAPSPTGRECVDAGIIQLKSDMETIAQMQTTRVTGTLGQLMKKVLLFYDQVLNDNENYFNGKQNDTFLQSWQSLTTDMQKLLENSPNSNFIKIMRATQVLLLRMFLTVLACQKDLSNSTGLKEAMEFYMASLKFLIETAPEEVKDLKYAEFLKNYEPKTKDRTFLSFVSAIKKLFS